MSEAWFFTLINFSSYGSIICHLLGGNVVEFNGNSTDYEEKLNAVITKYPHQDFYIGITDIGTNHKPRGQIFNSLPQHLKTIK